MNTLRRGEYCNKVSISPVIRVSLLGQARQGAYCSIAINHNHTTRLAT